ncbi:TetR/AcrR family transcriptional regulator [Corynebacterium heidelbergense]|nr:TetR/AcrR family transcriptional regulator [Corynebacterium heidelbergense]
MSDISESPTTPGDADPPSMGLRERKRQATRLCIEDTATRLFLEHSFDQVTLDEICADAGVSRRTFFNYFSSKDHVATGSLPPPLDEPAFEYVAKLNPQPDAAGGAQRDAFFAELLNFTGSLRAKHSATEEICALNPELSKAVAQRRAKIMLHNPTLAAAKLGTYEQLRSRLRDAVASNLKAYPNHRVTPADPGAEPLSLDDQALCIVSAITSALWTSSILATQEGRPVTLNRIHATTAALAQVYRGCASSSTPPRKGHHTP